MFTPSFGISPKTMTERTVELQQHVNDFTMTAEMLTADLPNFGDRCQHKDRYRRCLQSNIAPAMITPPPLIFFRRHILAQPTESGATIRAE
mmetsp:Transcript_26185/g.38371  ORF Transcript_26185/g.38371 Transcript_26185/m.38371 type:complete len:91 (-) Transcript_26185:764-1036(-)